LFRVRSGNIIFGTSKGYPIHYNMKLRAKMLENSYYSGINLVNNVNKLGNNTIVWDF
jgi:hypothetical protein